jgi:hypothetical protein
LGDMGAPDGPAILDGPALTCRIWLGLRVAELRSRVIGLWELNSRSTARDGSLTSRVTITISADSRSIRLLIESGEPSLPVSSGIQESATGRRAGYSGRAKEPREGDGVYSSPPNSELGEGSAAMG